MPSIVWIPKNGLQVVEQVLHRRAKIPVSIKRQHPIYRAKKYPPAGPESREAKRRRQCLVG